jgi:pyridoxal phosphate enzyme (YggS family)
LSAADPALVARVAEVRERMARAAEKAGRRAGDVTLVAVSKTHPAERVRQAFAAGLREFGESRVQEAEAKVEALRDLRASGLRWHLVGHLQANKARRAGVLFDCIHSVDDPRLGPRIEQAAAEERRVVSVLVQVDLAGEETKFGIDERRLFPCLESLRGRKSVRSDGLMVLPPFRPDPEESRPFFRRLRELRDRAVEENLLLGGELSMGMSHDLEVAVEEGATLVRVGTAIFGERGRV